MTITTRIITFGASAQQFPALSPVEPICKVRVEPLRSNSHVSYVGTAAVTNDASGVGVISELAQPGAATVPVDRFELDDSGGDDTVDPTQVWGHGTSGEKLKVTYFQR